MRLALGLLAAAAVTALGAVILGEYPFTGITPVAAGALMGVLIAEVVVVAGPGTGPVPGAAAAVLAAAGLVWAGWISTGHELGLMAPEGWAAVAVAAVAAGLAGWRPAVGAKLRR